MKIDKIYQPEHRTDKIHDLMTSMGFMQDDFGNYWHKYFGSEVKFDLSASGSGANEIMSHVFRVAIEWGEKSKLEQIKKVLEV